MIFATGTATTTTATSAAAAGGGEGGEVATLLRRHYVKVFKTSAGELMTGSEFLSLQIKTSDDDDDATCAEPDEMDRLAKSGDSQW
jgi:hypothetical protein